MAKAEAIDVNHDAIALLRALKFRVDNGAQLVYVQFAGIYIEISQFLNRIE